MPKDQQEVNTTMKADFKDPSSAKEAKQMLKEEEKQQRMEHSNSGSNTHKPQGMEYVTRKNHPADVPHNH
ncbi:hypothetical protein GE09DRAFT_1276740 [Coniochaeta sp. 2T2.1]|nr:hypothetical protein GE09DRAFT_1276740 [Coniochaeta sp. 2T2.1]